MATLQAGYAFNMAELLANGSLADFFEFGTVVQGTSSDLDVIYEGDGITEQLSLDGYFADYVDGYPTSGLIDGITYFVDNELLFDLQLTEFELGVEAFWDFVVNDDLAGLFTALMSGNDTINGSAGNDVLQAFAGHDIVYAGAGNDTVEGGDGDDTLIGDDGDDVLRGGLGNDSLYGGNGNDLLTESSGNAGPFGNDLYDGGAGQDRVSYYSDNGPGVTVDLRIAGAQETGHGLDTLVGIEHITATYGSDTLNGDDQSNWFWTFAGYDQLFGHGGNDYFTVGFGDKVIDGGAGVDTLEIADTAYVPVYTQEGITVSLALQGQAQAVGTGSWTISNVENLGGYWGDDELTGDANANILAGSTGNDTLTGGAGDDALYGDGVFIFNAVTGEAELVPINTVDGPGGNDLLYGGEGNDVLIGGGGNDVLEGGDGDDYIDGGDGNDTLRGGLGNDHLIGGAGNDFLSEASGNDGPFGDDIYDGGDGIDRVSLYTDFGPGVTVDLRITGPQNTGSMGTDTFIGIEHITSNYGDDVLNGNDSDNWFWTFAGYDQLFGHGGNDYFTVGYGDKVVDGGDGVDTLEIADTAYVPLYTQEGITVSLLLQGQAQQTGVGNWTITNVENLGGYWGDDELTGDANANVLAGSTGNDTLNGGGGDDLLYGDGVFILNAAGVQELIPVNTADGPGGNDIMNGGDGNDVLIGGGGNDSMSGGAGNDYLDGGDGDDSMSGNLGDDHLLGGAGNDFLTEGSGDNGPFGNDIYDGGDGVDRVSYWTTYGPGVTVDLNLTGPQDTGRGIDTLVGIEHVTASYGDNVLIGNEAGNWFWTFAGYDQLYGYGGNDLFTVGIGDKVIAGGEGSDTVEILDLSYAQAYTQAGISVSLALQGQAQQVGVGFWTLTGIENLGGSWGDDTLIGDAGDNILAGYEGSDTLIGGDGNDILLGDGGYDVGYSGSAWEQVEDSDDPNWAAGDDYLDGGAGNDHLVGGGGNDVLRGGDGDDTLLGGAGNDNLRGGRGVDYFDGGDNAVGVDQNGYGDRISFYEPTATQGVVADLETGIVSNDGFGNVETMVGIESLGSDTAFADIFYGNSGSNALFGNLGDSLYGRGGDDLFYISSAAAVVDGGDGVDTLTLDTSGGWLTADADGNGFADAAAAATSGWFVNLGGGQFTDGYGNAGIAVGIENINGSSRNDIINGDNSSNILFGNDGHDQLIGMGGDDTLNGGNGNDLLDGGAGDDFIDGGADRDVVRFLLNPGMSGTLTRIQAQDGSFEIWQVVDGALTEQLAVITVSESAITVTGLNSAAYLGTDVLTNVEQLVFILDQSRTVSVNLQPVLISSGIFAGSIYDDLLDASGLQGPLQIGGDYGNDTIIGTSGDDFIRGGMGSDTLTGGLGHDVFTDTAAGLNGDTITDFGDADAIIITDADIANFTFSLNGNVLTYTGGSLTLGTVPSGRIVASAADSGGVSLLLETEVADNDFNGDGRSDILWRNDNGLLGEWLGQADGSFVNNPAANAFVPTDWQIRGTGDFNGDGRVDILWRNVDGVVNQWLGQADGSFVNNPVANAVVPTNWNIAGTGDFNGDGRDDILWRNTDGLINQWLGQADGSFLNNPVADAFVPTNWVIAGTGDFNDDGRDDILWRNSDGVINQWLGQEDGSFANNPIANAIVPTDWHIIGTGDFNGDGNDDILWRNVNGVVNQWLGFDDGTFANNPVANAVVPTNWHVEAIGDYNGDGRDDLIWRNDDGYINQWLGQADGSFANNPVANVVVPTDWNIQDPDILYL